MTASSLDIQSRYPTLGDRSFTYATLKTLERSSFGHQIC